MNALPEIVVAYDPDGRWTLTSPEVPGLLMRGIDRVALMAAAPEAIAMLAQLNSGEPCR